MIAGFTLLLAKIAAFASWFADCFTQVFKDLWEVVIDLWSWPFDQMMQVVIAAAGAFDTSAITGSVAGWGQLPAELLNVLGLLGVGTALTIIGAAIVIRFGLQLIPFVRLGS